MKNFDDEVAARLADNGRNESLKDAAKQFIQEATGPKYCYNFSWQGRPIIQYPQDIVAMQELIYKVKPDLIIETGIAHGGSLIFSASMLMLLDISEAVFEGRAYDPAASKRHVVGVDIDIREHNRKAIEAHPMSCAIEMIQGSSVDPLVIARVREIAQNYQRIMVCLDSNHTHDHVLAELEAYAPLTSVGSYCVVFDTIIESQPAEMYPDRPWGPGDSPKSALDNFLLTHPGFLVDESLDNKLLISVSPSGYLRRVA